MSVRISIPSAVSVLIGVGSVASVGTAVADDDFLRPGTLVISSSVYENFKGAVANLNPNGPNPTQLASTDSATVSAVSDGNYVSVWSNEGPDASFGVTSPIFLTAVDARSGRPLRTLRVPEDQVVTSFSSKSELAVHYSGGHHAALVFTAYGGAGVGALDVSNSDAVAGQDPTNPVSFAFGSQYAFARTIVSVDSDGHLSYTPTVNYGGNNSRSALLGSNGLYYTVGNANNGNAATFGSDTNGTTPDVTQTTGLEVVKPINGRSAGVPIPAGNSAEVNPLLQFGLGKKGAADKPGKDNNFRGITEFNGGLYFTKGSGSNGVQTVYTIVTGAQSPAGFVPSPNSGPAAGNVLPTLANAAQLSIQILNGFPTDSARATGGDYTPFGLFFANDHTLYVADEGTGDSADFNPVNPTTGHAGLEKWVLGSNGIWTLQYTLAAGLLGTTDTNLVGRDGQYPDVTTVGLRNLSGRVNRDGTVTLWAATSTSSAATDVGADPNKIVEITDIVTGTSPVTGKARLDTFRTIAGPTYGTVYRGVAYIPGEEDCDDSHDRDGDHHFER
jgi:hypothetical protein